LPPIEGDPEAQYSFAWLFADLDKSEHVKWLTKAAEQGHNDAQVRLSLILPMGSKWAKDIVQEFKPDRILAETESANASKQ
jgi:TPR repeat protein